jgi:hypothetical protein
LITAALAATCPTLLANAPLVTSDAWAALAFFAATISFQRALDSVETEDLFKSCGHFGVAGAIAGLLVASKHSGVLFALIAPPLLLRSASLSKSRSKFAIKSISLSGLAASLAYATLWGSFRFRYDAFVHGEGVEWRNTFATSDNYLKGPIGDSLRFAQKYRLLPGLQPPPPLS